MDLSENVIDTLIKNAKVFNNGEDAVIEDVAVSNGRVVARGANLEAKSASRVIDATGLWLMPGLFDIHTCLLYTSPSPRDRG